MQHPMSCTHGYSDGNMSKPWYSPPSYGESGGPLYSTNKETASVCAIMAELPVQAGTDDDEMPWKQKIESEK